MAHSLGLAFYMLISHLPELTLTATVRSSHREVAIVGRYVKSEACRALSVPGDHLQRPMGKMPPAAC